MEADDDVTFQAFDEDVGSSDFLGATRPLPFRTFCLSEKAQEFTFDLLIKKAKDGTLKIQTKYTFEIA